MKTASRRTTLHWIGIALVYGSAALAGQSDLDRALERYYAGHPASAFEILEPLARAGDVDAQYLLGNMSYALARAGTPGADWDPVRWYRMAAGGGSTEAAYALGAIYNNRWLASRDEQDAHLAEHYYQQAADGGYLKAQAPLLKLASRHNAEPKARSLTYTNASFPGKQETRTEQPVQAADAPAPQLSAFAPSGDPIADAARLQQALRQLGVGGELLDAGKTLDEQRLRGLLDGIGADALLVDKLMKLLDQLQSVNEHSLAPGAN